MPKEILTDDICEKIARAALIDADAKAYNAGMNGSWADDGASAIRQTVEDWKHGLAGTVPPRLEQYRKKVLQEEDPEYAEYLRLREKFKNK